MVPVIINHLFLINYNYQSVQNKLLGWIHTTSYQTFQFRLTLFERFWSEFALDNALGNKQSVSRKWNVASRTVLQYTLWNIKWIWVILKDYFNLNIQKMKLNILFNIRILFNLLIRPFVIYLTLFRILILKV